MSDPKAGNALASAKRWLRSPVTITGEVLGAAAIGVVRATVPQASDLGAWSQFAEEQPRLAQALHATWLDRVVVSPWAVVVFGLSALSLGIVFVEVTRRAARRWGTPPAERSFATAPFRAEVDLAPGVPEPTACAEVRGRVGLLGVPLLHAGILVVILAGLARALLGADATAWVMEGETLEAGTRDVTATETGFLASPFALEEPVRLDRVDLLLRPDGSVDRESAMLSVGAPARAVPIAINEAIHVGSGRLYLTQRHGIALLVEGGATGSDERRALLLSASDAGYAGQDVLRDGTVVRAQGRVPPGPLTGIPAVDLRILKGPALLHAGSASAGQTVEWPGGKLSIHGSVPWVEIRMTRDPSIPVAWTGAVLLLLGVTLFAVVTPVDVLVLPGPSGDGVRRARVALRPHRFAALHESDFHALVERVRSGDRP